MDTKTVESMKTIDIKGKQYVQVNERIKYFRNSDDYKGWPLVTEMLSNENGMCVFKAFVYDKEGVLASTGHAYEKEGSSFINKTSYIENCETSAIGRALGNLGIGIDTSIASAEEVQNAIKNQNTKQPDPVISKTNDVTWDDKAQREEFLSTCGMVGLEEVQIKEFENYFLARSNKPTVTKDNAEILFKHFDAYNKDFIDWKKEA